MKKDFEFRSTHFSKWVMCLLLGIFMMGLPACGDDDDDSVDSRIIGTWQCVDESDWYITFNRDGSGYETDDDEVGLFSYTIKKNTIIFDFVDDDWAFDNPGAEYEIAGDFLSLIFTYDAGEKETITFRKVK